MAATWTDFAGRAWPIVRSRSRLNFKYPAHAALRAHVFHRDGFRCVRCGVSAVNVPAHYDGRYALDTSAVDGGGWTVPLILDHILTLPAGGRSVIENLQALCELCNKSKQREDIAATKAFRGEVA